MNTTSETFDPARMDEYLARGRAARSNAAFSLAGAIGRYFHELASPQGVARPS